MATIHVNSPNVKYSEEYIESEYNYQTTDVQRQNGYIVCEPKDTKYTFRTERRVPKLGVMLVGWGGNNGSTVTGMVIANRLGLSWSTKDGVHKADYLGSITQASTVLLGSGPGGEVYVPFKNLLPMVDPNDIVFDGWDINSMNLADAMNRGKVFDYNLQQQLRPHMIDMKPRPSIYYPDFIAANQAERADNLVSGTKQEQLDHLRSDIRDFKNKSGVDSVIVLWTANTERFSEVRKGLNDTADNLLNSIQTSQSEVSASTMFAVASILEGCTFINGAPQNTNVPGVIELAERHKVYIGGDDFKSGQTKVKSVLVDFLVGAGIKPTSIVSYNHLGNNDGKNLSAAAQFKSKEITKRSVVDDMVESNSIMYEKGEHPDHCIVIKYVPYVADSKRAMDEYTAEIAMGGKQTIVMHNTCEDSLLASPLIIDLCILAELCQRITFRVDDGKMNGNLQQVDGKFQRFNSILSILSYMLKAPLVPEGTPLVNALFRQRGCMENIFRACIGLPPVNHMMLEHKHEQIACRKNIDKVGIQQLEQLGASVVANVQPCSVQNKKINNDGARGDVISNGHISKAKSVASNVNNAVTNGVESIFQSNGVVANGNSSDGEVEK